jgi:hypothetical protein
LPISELKIPMLTLRANAAMVCDRPGAVLETVAALAQHLALSKSASGVPVRQLQLALERLSGDTRVSEHRLTEVTSKLRNAVKSL